MIKRLAFQRLQQIAKEHPDLTEKCRQQNNSEALNDIVKQEPNETVPSKILTKEELDRITTQLETPMNVNGNVKDEPLTMEEKFITEEKVRSVTLDLERSMSQIQIRSRALLIPVNDIMKGDRWYTDATNIDDAVQMRYRSISIGTGIGNDLNLLLFGKCCHTSMKHAVIFYDEVRVYKSLIKLRIEL